MSTDTSRLPPLPPFAVTPVATTIAPAANPPQQDSKELLATEAWNPSERAEHPLTAKKAPVLSQRANDLLSALIVLFAGVSILIWADRLDRTESQWFVTAAATGSAFTPAVLFMTLRAFRRQEPHPMPVM